MSYVFNTQMTPGVVRLGEGQMEPVLGHTITFKAGGQELDGAAFVWEVYSPQGTFVPPHIHNVEDELIYIAEGELQVLVGDTMYQACPGDLIKMPKNVPHGIWQKGDKPTRTLWTVIPAGKMESLFHALGALPKDQPPDPARIGQIFAEHDLVLLPPPQN
jgi:quercetin dioxygenase-like cupin family protein